MKKKKRKRLIIYIFLLLVFCLGLELYASNNLIQVNRVYIEKNEIPKPFNGFKIVQISDLHNKSFGDKNSSLIDKIKNESPNIIVMTGDMLSNWSSDIGIMKNLCQELTKLCKVYFIVGNHEQNYKQPLPSSLKQVFKDTGVVFLDNEKIAITKDKKSISIYGLWTHLSYYRDLSNSYSRQVQLQENDITKLLGKPTSTDFNILLTHNPVYFEQYSKWGADLTLCGHMHGGMLRIPFIGGLLSPEREFFPKYDAGLFEDSGNYLYVNRGLGNGTFGFRMFNRPEITTITLKVD